MARRRRAIWLVLQLLLLTTAACSRDFSSFEFDHDSGRTRIDPAQTPDGGPADARAPDAGGDAAQVITAGQSGGGVATAGGGAAGTTASADAGANEDDAGEEDAGVEEPDLAPQCRAQWDAALGVPSSCRDCACERCAAPVLGCDALGDERARKLCDDVVACALENHCQDYSCYCTSTLCNFPEDVGDGPCAALINQAAGGTRSRVLTLRNAEVPDLANPMIRAVQAVGCVLGVAESSPRPTEAGACAAECSGS